MVRRGSPRHDARRKKHQTMKNTVFLPAFAFAFASLAVVLVSEFTTAQEAPVPPRHEGPDIIAVATADPNLTTLVSALRAAELTDILKTHGPFTVFAPNNAAFAKLPAGTLDSLMMPENKRRLAELLKNHVVRDETKASDVETGKTRTLSGGHVELKKSEGKISYGGATVVVADMEASNGVVHVIDAVVMPD